MKDTDTIAALEKQATNTKRLVDRINRAYYGMTWDEHERLHGRTEGNHEPTGQAAYSSTAGGGGDPGGAGQCGDARSACTRAAAAGQADP